jgi:hypothetical protein
MNGVIENDRLLADFACLDPIYVDGIARILNLGTNFQVLYFRWVPTQSKHGLTTMEKAPAASVIRPKTSIMQCSQSGCDFLKWVETDKAPGHPEVPLH